jgi:hypothetical protein
MKIRTLLRDADEPFSECNRRDVRSDHNDFVITLRTPRKRDAASLSSLFKKLFKQVVII